MHCRAWSQSNFLTCLEIDLPHMEEINDTLLSWVLMSRAPVVGGMLLTWEVFYFELSSLAAPVVFLKHDFLEQPSGLKIRIPRVQALDMKCDPVTSRTFQNYYIYLTGTFRRQDIRRTCLKSLAGPRSVLQSLFCLCYINCWARWLENK